MFSSKKILLLLALTLSSLSPFAAADWGSWGGGGGLSYKSDLRVGKVEPANPSTSNASVSAFVVIVNEGLGSSNPCWVRLTVFDGVTSVTKYAYVQAVPGNSGIGFNVYLGTSIMASPGLVTQAYVDVFGQESEVNEYNNVGYHVAPAW